MIDYPQGQKLNYGNTQMNYIGINHHNQYSVLVQYVSDTLHLRLTERIEPSPFLCLDSVLCLP